jgi:acetyl-CoA carboxylase carboxyl transferase subunit alpha
MGNAFEKVQAARLKGRPTSLSYMQQIFSDFIELHGDRRYADDEAVVGGIAWLRREPVTVIGIEKGSSTKERIRRNFGAPSPEGYRKALRLMKQAEKFHRPVICFVDTAGAYCGVGAEKRGQGQAIAENLMEMMTLRTPVVSVFIGEGGSGGALALAVADRVLMLENAVYSVISPEGCASILWKDPKKVKEAAECLGMTAEDMLRLEIADAIVPETGRDLPAIAAALEEELWQTLEDRKALPAEQLLEERYARFRKIGAV